MGYPYSQIGATSARHLVQTVGLPPMVTNLPVPDLYKDSGLGSLRANTSGLSLTNNSPSRRKVSRLAGRT